MKFNLFGQNLAYVYCIVNLLISGCQPLRVQPTKTQMLRCVPPKLNLAHLKQLLVFGFPAE